MFRIIFTIILFLNITGCSTKEDKAIAHSIFQTTGASAVREYTDILMDYLLKYKLKLDKRNPNYHSIKNSKVITDEISNGSSNINMQLLKYKSSTTYNEYLNIAFSKEYVKNRNDYLIIGIYKLLYWAYSMDRAHTITTMQYDIAKIQKANKLMQIIQYKIQTNKDKNGNYLFITWQRPWQIEILRNKNKKIDLDRYTKEELLYHSNMNFQVISSSMIFIIQETLRYLGAEVTNLSTQALKGVFIFL